MEPEFLAQHHERLAAIDPMVAATVVGEGPGTELAADTDTGQCQAKLSYDEIDQSEQMALWRPAKYWNLTIAVTGADPSQALSQVLDRVDGLVPETSDPDTAVGIRIPSRDTHLVKPLVYHHFYPAITTAYRLARAQDAMVSDEGLRTWRIDDLEQLRAGMFALFGFDEQFGAFGNPPAIATMVGAYADQTMGYPDDHRLLIEDEKGLAGLVTLVPPADSSWAGAQINGDPVGYLGHAWVRDDLRGSGIGRRLATAAHAAASRSGYQLVLLDYLAANPLSAPFWTHMGYQPLCTTWLRRPAR